MPRPDAVSLAGRAALLALALATSCVRAGFAPPDAARPRADLASERSPDVGRDAPREASADYAPCAGGCAIEGGCRAAGAVDPGEPCRVCDPSFNAWGWSPAKGCVITVAGGAPGFVDGPAPLARLDTPEELALDADGRLYIADAKNERVRVLARGELRTFAGSGVAGFADGPAPLARFNYPHGVAVDAAGAVYVAEIKGLRIRRIAGGVVTTVAGDGTEGYVDGPALGARFASVYSLALSAGKLYVTDLAGSRVRVLSAGVVSTVAGDGTRGFQDGPAAAARFDGLYGIAVDPAGRLWVAEQIPGNRIRLIDGNLVGTVIGAAGPGYADGPLASARIANPNGLGLAAGRLYIADCGNGSIRVVEQNLVSTIAGTGAPGFADGPVKAARFSCPTGIAVHPRGYVYVGDSGNDRIRAINP